MKRYWHRLLCLLERHNVRPHVCKLCEGMPLAFWECTRCGKLIGGKR